MTRVTCGAITLLALLPSALPAQGPPARPDWLHPCSLGQVETPALCGTYEVWENRDTRQGRRIPLRVIVVPATGQSPAPDPVFHFAGGPGGSSASSAAGLSRAYARVNQRRDLVFVDVRGTGESHPLRCPTPGPDDPLQDWFREFLSDDMVRACLAAQDADVRYYTNAVAMDDVNEVREALGYALINLDGGSGGTRQEQVYIRRHPTTVRSAVLRGVVPMDFEMPLPFSKAMETGVRGVIETCRQSPECNGRYPDLAGDWERSTRYFDQGTVEATVKHPATGRSERVRIDRGVYADGIRHILYTMRGAARLPGMLHLAAQGNFDAFAQQELEQSIGYARALSMGVFMSVSCAEDVPFISEADIERATTGTFLGDYRVRRQQAACRIWPRGVGVDERFQDPVSVDVPVLTISGDRDTATPAEGGERVARGFPRGRHVVFPKQSHDMTNPQCAVALIAAFYEAASAENLDVGCIGGSEG